MKRWTKHISKYYFNPFPDKPWFLRVCCISFFENTVRKGKIARNEQFLLFSRCFLPIRETFCHFHQISNCRLQTLLVWKSLKFVVRERVKKIKDIPKFMDRFEWNIQPKFNLKWNGIDQRPDCMFCAVWSLSTSPKSK